MPSGSCGRTVLAVCTTPPPWISGSSGTWQERQAARMFDVLIRNGSVMDGTGGPAYLADVAVAGDEITVIGRVDAEAKTTIDATGRVVCPGFIDLHTHS